MSSTIPCAKRTKRRPPKRSPEFVKAETARGGLQLRCGGHAGLLGCARLRRRAGLLGRAGLHRRARLVGRGRKLVERKGQLRLVEAAEHLRELRAAEQVGRLEGTVVADHDPADVADSDRLACPGSDRVAVLERAEGELDVILGEDGIRAEEHAVEHDGHLLTGDGAARAERAVLIAADHAGVVGPDDRIRVPRGGVDIAQRAGQIGHVGLVRELIHHLRDHGAGRRDIGGELVVAHAGHQAGRLRKVDGGLIPAARGVVKRVFNNLQTGNRGAQLGAQRHALGLGLGGGQLGLDGGIGLVALGRVGSLAHDHALHIGDRRGDALIDHDAAGRLGIVLTDHALELLGDVFHDHFVQRQAGIELVGGCGKRIVRVAAAGHEVVRDDGIGGLGVKVLAVDRADGN